MQLPEALLNSLERIKGFNRASFIRIHESGEQVNSIRLNLAKPIDSSHQSLIYNLSSLIPKSVPWEKLGCYLPQRPSYTFDPLFHAGCYYVQEASSMFLGHALRECFDLSQPLKVLDLCAAPGGKSTHIQSLISPGSILVSNEVIRSRVNVLKENIIKWGAGNTVITRNDPADFRQLENYFDLIVVDAPCSGSGLFRRDTDAIKEWSEDAVKLCNRRQQRILEDAWPALKENGVLIYATCSYSKEEDEDIVDRLLQEHQAVSIPLPVNSDWGIVEIKTAAGASAYRFFPDKLKGEGFFLACLRKINTENTNGPGRGNKMETPDKKEMQIIGGWIKEGSVELVRNDKTIYAWPAGARPDFELLISRLRVIYSGVVVGEMARDKLIPDHSLALSNLLHPSVIRTELDKKEAIRFLQKKELKSTLPKGWQVACFEGHALGWMNGLGNRVNNYYPKDWRILKES
ncbi:MAG TPA: hypothetical protein VLJ68_09205 [Chitinophagaceae bacterium]|nr:hypothetical protein [Chitinophagaceae bacterium]